MYVGVMVEHMSETFCLPQSLSQMKKCSSCRVNSSIPQSQRGKLYAKLMVEQTAEIYSKASSEDV